MHPVYLTYSCFQVDWRGANFRFPGLSNHLRLFSCFLHNNTRYEQAVCCSELVLKIPRTGFFLFSCSVKIEAFGTSAVIYIFRENGWAKSFEKTIFFERTEIPRTKIFAEAK